MFIGDGSIAGNRRPQARQVDAFDRPEKRKAALIDKGQRLGLGRKWFGGREVKSPRAMRFN